MLGKKTKLICVEGPDRVGKATQALLLVEYLCSRGHKVAFIEVPIFSNTISYRLIYWMLKNGLAVKFPHIFQVMHFLNKYTFQVCKLQQFVDFDYVVFDRWRLSSLVYGSLAGAKFGIDWMYQKLVQPDMTIVLHGSSYKRDEVEDAYERDHEFQRRVASKYVEWAETNDKCAAVSCNSSQETVHKDILNVLDDANLL